jgi:hypothetical protein
MYHHFQHQCSDTKTQGGFSGWEACLLVPVCAVCSSSLLLSCPGSYACMLLCSCCFCGFLPAVCATGLRCELSSGGFAACNTFSWSTSLAAGVGCGWHQPTSHCACPLNFCLISGKCAGRLMIGQPSRLCFLNAEGLVPRKQHYSGVWCIQRAHTCSNWTSTVGCASCACMRSLAFRRGMGDSAQCLLHAGAVTLSHRKKQRKKKRTSQAAALPAAAVTTGAKRRRT